MKLLFLPNLFTEAGDIILLKCSLTVWRTHLYKNTGSKLFKSAAVGFLLPIKIAEYN